jgi:hypothetical protein
MATLLQQTEPSPLTRETPDGFLIHEKAEDMPHLKPGPYVRLDSGRLITISLVSRKTSTSRIAVSDDDGQTWAERDLPPCDAPLALAPSGALLKTADGTVVLGFANVAERSPLEWDPELKDCPDARLPTYVMRSLDGGDTWQDPQKLHDEWTGATRDALQTRDGRILFTSMKLLHNPGRHSVMTYASDDDGETWQPSNVMDLGGNGHHDGVTEGTFVELQDGRLLMYMRTNWGQFWRALSADGGRSWHPYGPSGIPAGSAPGMLKRLASGRIALAWNRPWPESGEAVELRGGDGIWSATPARNFRHELSLSFSDDECETWSPPVVVVRNPEGEASYPFVFEAEPGVLWITAWRWNLRIKVREADVCPATPGR